jgi:hypothetical protein
MGYEENSLIEFDDFFFRKKPFKICLSVNNKTSELLYTGQRGWYQKQHVK